MTRAPADQDTEYLPMRVDDPWLVKLAQGWSLPFLGLLLPHGAMMVVWLWRPVDA